METKAQSATITPGQGSPDTGRLARILLDLAAKVEEAELEIKQAILVAARSGNAAKVEAIVQLWMTSPPVDVAANLKRMT